MKESFLHTFDMRFLKNAPLIWFSVFKQYFRFGDMKYVLCHFHTYVYEFITFRKKKVCSFKIALCPSEPFERAVIPINVD